MLRSLLLLSLALPVMSACGRNASPAVAQITTIDRTCTIVERRVMKSSTGDTVGGPGKEVGRYKGDCNQVDEWDEVKRSGKRNIDGDAEVHFTYVGPDGQSRNGSLKFTGRDREFYELKAGDQFDIMVDAEHPEDVWRA